VSSHRSKATKRALCDTLEALSCSDDPPAQKRYQVLPDLYDHAMALATEKAQGLPGTARDELVSSLGERVAVALERLETEAPPAQQATYLDGVLRHALADAGRGVDPLGRGPRTMRRRYETTCEAVAQANGALPAQQERYEILDEIVGPGKPVLRLLVGQGMGPDEAAAHLGGAGSAQPDDPAEQVARASVRHQIAKAIAAHPDRAVREYLFKVAAGLTARRPSDFHARLGRALPELIGDLLLERDCG
jgi:hypothetical protein